MVELSALADEEHVRAGLAAGASAYVPEPFSPRELGAVVESLPGMRL